MDPREVTTQRTSSPRYSLLPLSDEEDEDEDEGENNVDALLAAYPSFWGHVKLSILVAIWMTVFGAFSYSTKFRGVAFGEPSCENADLDWKELDGGQRVWCGFFPNAYLPYWENAVQMIIFTVYVNTGTTVMQAWQGVAGTACAVANRYVMGLIWPSGADNAVVWLDILLFFFAVLASGSAMNTMIFASLWHAYFMMGFLDPNRGVDACDFPTFIPNLAWDSEAMVALMTSFFGASLAILATILQKPTLTNFNKVVDETDNIVSAVDRIWTEVIHYVCGQARSAKCLQIKEAVHSANCRVSEIRGNLANSWWENFDLCSYGKKRALYEGFDISMQSLHDVMIVMQDTIQTISFSEESRQFRSGLQDAMMGLKNCTVELLHRCVQACADGDIDQNEMSELQRNAEAIVRAQQELHLKYLEVSQSEISASAPNISSDFMKENIFLFSLSAWARKVADFAGAILEVDQILDEHGQHPLATFGTMLKTGFLHTCRIPDKDRALFAARNFVTIGGSFVINYLFGKDPELISDEESGGTIFPPYSSVMPSTLSVLIHEFTGGALLSSLKRLTGVTVGKVLPLVILCAVHAISRHVSQFECGNPCRDFVVGLAVFTLTVLSVYMYFSSPQFGTIGCLVAAYGAGILSGECGTVTADLEGKYSELAQIVCALTIQICVEMGFESAQNAWPRERAVKAIEQINDELVGAYKCFLEGNLSMVDERQKRFKVLLSKAQELTVHADPSLDLVRCCQTPFKIDLYKGAIRILELLKADLTIVFLACEAWRPEPLLRENIDLEPLVGRRLSYNDNEQEGGQSLLPHLHTTSGMSTMQAEFMHDLEVVLSSLYKLLNHGFEDNNFQEEEDTKKLLSVSNKETVTNVHHLIAEINAQPLKLASTAGDATQLTEDQRVRLTVVVGGLCQARAHIGELDKLVLQRVIL